jgi:hypothetical protein
MPPGKKFKKWGCNYLEIRKICPGIKTIYSNLGWSGMGCEDPPCGFQLLVDFFFFRLSAIRVFKVGFGRGFCE